MPTITSTRPTFFKYIESDIFLPSPQTGKALPLTAAINMPRNSTASTSAPVDMASANDATPSGFTFDEAFPPNQLLQDHPRSIDLRARDALLFPPEEHKPTRRAHFKASLVHVSHKKAMDRICHDVQSEHPRPYFQENPKSAPVFLKTAARELAGILTTLDDDTQWKTHQTQRHHARNQLSETVKDQLYAPGKLSVEQRLMLYSFPQIKKFIIQLSEDFPYDSRGDGSSRKLLIDHSINVLMAFEARLSGTEKLLIDTYMQKAQHAVSEAMVSQLAHPELLGRVLERTSGLGIEQQREIAEAEIQRVWDKEGKRLSDAGRLCGALARANNTPSRLHTSAVAPPKPPRAAPKNATAAPVSPVGSASVPPQAPTFEPGPFSAHEALAMLRRNFPNYAEAQAQRQMQDTATSPGTPPRLQNAATSPGTPPSLAETGGATHRSELPSGLSAFGTLKLRFKSLFKAARKLCIPEWESRTKQRQWQALRLQAATRAYDKIIDQAADIVHALRHGIDRPSEAGNSNDPGNRIAIDGSRIAGAAREAMLRTGKVSLDLGRQLSLHPLLSASDSHALQLASTYDIDAIHALETGGLLNADQRGLLYGLRPLVHALAQLPSSLKSAGSETGAKFAQANIALARLVEMQDEAHDTLTNMCVRENLSLEERAAIFNDRTVAHLMELTAGQPDAHHDYICWRMVHNARLALQDPESSSVC